MKEIHKYLNEIRESREPIVIHCRDGKGRTGMVLALYLYLFHKKTTEECIKEIKTLR